MHTRVNVIRWQQSTNYQNQPNMTDSECVNNVFQTDAGRKKGITTKGISRRLRSLGNTWNGFRKNRNLPIHYWPLRTLVYRLVG